ncbi:DUF5785 family protein [Halorutilales archaeon Cl-col2-1]
MAITEPDDGRSYGMAKVTHWVDEEDFPITKDDLEEHADEDLMLSYEESVRFGDVLERVDQTEFDGIVDMWQSLGDVLRQIDPDRVA